MNVTARQEDLLWLALEGRVEEAAQCRKALAADQPHSTYGAFQRVALVLAERAPRLYIFLKEQVLHPPRLSAALAGKAVAL